MCRQHHPASRPQTSNFAAFGDQSGDREITFEILKYIQRINRLRWRMLAPPDLPKTHVAYSSRAWWRRDGADLNYADLSGANLSEAAPGRGPCRMPVPERCCSFAIEAPLVLIRIFSLMKALCKDDPRPQPGTAGRRLCCAPHRRGRARTRPENPHAVELVGVRRVSLPAKVHAPDDLRTVASRP